MNLFCLEKNLIFLDESKEHSYESKDVKMLVSRKSWLDSGTSKHDISKESCILMVTVS